MSDKRQRAHSGRVYRLAGIGLWAVHILLARVGFYRCPKCKGPLNYRWWCKRCERYRIPTR